MEVHSLSARLAAAHEATRGALLAARKGLAWAGELSSSALSTATAVTALLVARRGGTHGSEDADCQEQVSAGLGWLAAHVNADGGWGDTTLSVSNLSTTTLCWAAFGAAADERYKNVVLQAERWLREHAGSIDPDRLAKAIIARYGTDRTFSVPILTMCALAGRLGEGPKAWRNVIPLPFELAAFPASWFAALRLPVVSYALPALIAIGQAHHVHAPSANPLVRFLRQAVRARTMRVLDQIQPENGGFLEATPLTSFVVMSLGGSGEARHRVTERGLKFLRQAMRADGSWPIDTNLATWLTTLSIGALYPDSASSVTATSDASAPKSPDEAALTEWLLAQQYQQRHPYTGAAPGAWAWTNLPGGVPDADDTAGAVIALRRLRSSSAQTREAALAGVGWLVQLQNRDGGIPTFCRGWGTLPFDRSSADITAHALRAWIAWTQQIVGTQLEQPWRRAVLGAIHFLARTQRPEGAWVPLWFGNQFAAEEENRTYGTSRVVLALQELATHPLPERETAMCRTMLERAVVWLVDAQHPEGAWGGDVGVAASMEESACALEALAMVAGGYERRKPDRLEAAVRRGTEWLVERVENGTWTQPAPIGFYFARLWYFERLYPIIFVTSALAAACRSGVFHSPEHERGA